MILIYCPDLTARKQYIFKHIFKRMMQTDYDVTSDLSAFVSHDGIKFSYGNKPLGDEMFIWSMGLLDEHGIDDHAIEMTFWDDLPAFFAAPETSSLPFDIFSAAFYLITRYEEYLPQVKDEYGRYSPQESVAYKNNFLALPLVDLWMNKLSSELSVGEITLSRKRNTHKKITFEIGSFYKYRHRGILVNLRSFSKSVRQLNLSRAVNQLRVLLNLAIDPYDNIQSILDVLRATISGRSLREQVIFFYHLGNFTGTDTGTTYKSKTYIEQIKHVGDYTNLGLRFSSNADQRQVLQEEKRFEELLKRPLGATMAAMSKISMPGHYKLLVDTKSVEDYSMGYVNMPGYRASTSQPFYFYDLDYEVQTPLVIKPYALHYNAIMMQTLDGQMASVRSVKNSLKHSGGNLTVQFYLEHFDSEINSHAMKILKYLIDE
ncbi:DUF7033 domain-containing protein [Nonlabens ponticola]|uniref:DUF7033 domain-containing protein n=1 Tax=Nonlabens ponticola TaxID=2496866 RepID=A0A3S9N0V0_9FLAO|nr:hypothetical protein [Nonlabens ponticola]AZQ45018.1 hypothetical protein EJ995_12550 [Nonlabens ponticola]